MHEITEEQFQSFLEKLGIDKDIKFLFKDSNILVWDFKVYNNHSENGWILKLPINPDNDSKWRPRFKVCNEDIWSDTLVSVQSCRSIFHSIKIGMCQLFTAYRMKNAEKDLEEFKIKSYKRNKK